jgi:hypothetical protein
LPPESSGKSPRGEKQCKWWNLELCCNSMSQDTFTRSNFHMHPVDS